MPNYHQFLRTRRSVRRFLDRPVPDDVLHRILETATYAPSAHHRQHWRFVVLQKQASKERLAHHMGAAFRRDLEADGLHPQKVDELVGRSRQRILSAPLAVVLCFDPTVGDDYPDETRQRAEYMMGVQSAALSGLQFLLAAHAEGMEGSGPVGRSLPLSRCDKRSICPRIGCHRRYFSWAIQ